MIIDPFRFASSVSLDHHETITYVGDATYPRAITTTVDPTNGITWWKDRDTGGAGFKPLMIFPEDLVGASRYRPTSDTTAGASNTTVTFTSSSITLGSNAVPASTLNTNTKNFVLWVFKYLAGFMVAVPYTGNSTNRTIAHPLGIAPGFMMCLNRAAADNIVVWHRSMTSAANAMLFDSGAAQASMPTAWNSTAPDASVFSVGNGSAFLTNRTGNSYTMLLFGHDTGASGRIQCGSYTGNGSASGPTVSLGWDPRWLMIKNLNASSTWYIIDTTRTPGLTGNTALLGGDVDSAESATAHLIGLTGSGFQLVSSSSTLNGNTVTYGYVAIR